MQKTFLFILLINSSIIAGIPSLEDLSLDEKIGQLFMVATTSNPARNIELMAQTPYQLDPMYVQDMIENHHIGGVVFLGNGIPREQARVTNLLQKQSAIPLLIALDAEWGLAMRHLEDVVTYLRAMTLGALSPSDDDLIYELGLEIGNQCKTIGVQINFAPVADVNVEPSNPVINSRSFGQDPYLVAKKVVLFMQGMQAAGIIACAKHFPGHGDTKEDSHYTLPVVPHSKERLETIELVPFQHAIENGISAIMTAHLAVPAVTEKEDLPVTFSQNILKGILRTALRFKGLLFTDGLGMKGVTDKLEPGEPELKALQAGHDILLCPVDVSLAVARIKQALKDGTLRKEEIDEHVERILDAKRRTSFDTPACDSQILQSARAKQLKEQLYRAAITLARNENGCIPVRNSNTPIPVITNGPRVAPFIETVRKHIAITHYHLDMHPSPEACTALEQQLEAHQRIITVVDVPGRSGMLEMQDTSNERQTSAYVDLINRLGKRAILVLFGNPYNLAHTPHSQATIVAYETEPEAQEAAADTIIGRHNPRGKLPVTAGEAYPCGTGLNY